MRYKRSNILDARISTFDMKMKYLVEKKRLENAAQLSR